MTCGHCQVSVEQHPVPQCKYTFAPVLDAKGKTVGYEMTVIDSPIRAIHDGSPD